MFWSKKKIDDDKENQIKNLKVVFPSVRRPNNDDSLFEIKFVIDNQYSSLRIFIPADFPMTRPVLQVSGPVTHPWLDHFKQVNGCGKLMNWTKTSSLVEVVEETMSALLSGVNGPAAGAPVSSAAAQYNPVAAAAMPPVQQYSAMPAPGMTHSSGYPGVGGLPPAIPYNSQTTQHQQSMYGVRQQQPTEATSNSGVTSGASSGAGGPTALNRAVSSGITMPEVPSSFPELERLTDLQLERVLADEVTFSANLNKMAPVDSIRSLLDQMQRSNYEAASKNLALDQDVCALQKQAEDLQRRLADSLKIYNDKLSAAAQQFQVNRTEVFSELSKKRSALDDRSEELGRGFVDGRAELSSFVPEFLEVRGNYHSLSAKIAVAAAAATGTTTPQ